MVFAEQKLLIQEIETSNGTSYRVTSEDKAIIVLECDDRDRIIAGSTPEIRFERTFDEEGKLLSESWDNGLFIDKQYDDHGRLLSISIPGADSIRFKYDKKDRLSHVEYGPYFHFFHYSKGKSIDVETNSLSSGEVKYAYDERGFRTSLISPHLVQQTTYDTLGKVEQITTNNESVPYRFNSDGQLLSEGEVSYLFDGLLRLNSYNGLISSVNAKGQVELLGDVSCEYDDLGRLIAKHTPEGTMHFSYNRLSQLCLAENKHLRIHFFYDALGRRIEKITEYKTLPDRQEISRESYLYDGIFEIASYVDGNLKELRVLGENNYLHPLFIQRDDKVYFPLSSQQGHTLCLSSLDQVQFSPSFTSFGKYSGQLLHPWAFSGHRYDLETGLFYFGKRYYDPDLLTWITPDPLGKANSQNLYQFLLNDPLNHSDIEGCFALAIPIIGFLIDAVIEAAIWAVGVVVTGCATSKAIDDIKKHKTKDKEEIIEKPPYDGRDLGNDPTKCPEDGFEWKGKGSPESGQGSWYNEGKKHSLHPDLDHPEGKDPHWDYSKKGSKKEARLFLDGSFEWK